MGAILDMWEAWVGHREHGSCTGEVGRHIIESFTEEVFDTV